MATNQTPAVLDDPFSEPGPTTGGGRFPSMAQLKGRLLLVRPTQLDRNVTSPANNKPHDRITADVVILDGPPIPAVLDKDGDPVHEYDEPLAPPCKLEGMWIAQIVMVNQLRKAVKSDGLVLGRVTQLPARKGQNKPWSLDAPTDADKDAARKYLAAHPLDDEDPFASA